MLTKPGSPCLSAYRQQQLLLQLQQLEPSITSVYAEYVHFADVDGVLTPEEEAILDRLLTYGPQTQSAAHTGTMLLVMPRQGTISPWSSKATDIAHNCTLHKIKRLERGTAYWIAGEAKAITTNAQVLQSLHDRMTQVKGEGVQGA